MPLSVFVIASIVADDVVVLNLNFTRRETCTLIPELYRILNYMLSLNRYLCKFGLCPTRKTTIENDPIPITDHRPTNGTRKKRHRTQTVTSSKITIKVKQQTLPLSISQQDDFKTRNDTKNWQNRTLILHGLNLTRKQ